MADSTSVSLSSGWNHSRILDEYLSPIPYKGGGFLIQTDLEKYNEPLYNHLVIIFQMNKIEPDLENNSSANLFRGNIDWIRGKELKTGGNKFNVFAGGHLLSSYGALSHNVWQNNSYSHCLALSIGPSLIMSLTPFQSPYDLRIAWEVSFPVLNYIFRPSAGSILPEGTLENGEKNFWTILTGGRICSLNDYMRILSNVHLSTRFTKRMNLLIGYKWDFQDYTVDNHYQSVNHLIYMGLSYRFKR